MEDCETLTVFPNPSYENVINICVPDLIDQYRWIRIVDIAGKVVYEQNRVLEGQVFDIETYHMRPGDVHITS